MVTDDIHAYGRILPEPEFKVSVKTLKSGVKKYFFDYKVKKPQYATKVQIRMVKGGSKAINRYLDKYVHNVKCNKKKAYIQFTKASIKKLKKIEFKITVFYGKVKIEGRDRS